MGLEISLSGALCYKLSYFLCCEAVAVFPFVTFGAVLLIVTSLFVFPGFSGGADSLAFLEACLMVLYTPGQRALTFLSL